jgi:hypothetical protein
MELTQVIMAPDQQRVPLLMEVPVSRALDGPFLVTSSKDFLWVSNAFPNGMIRAAVRTVPLEFLFRDAILKVAEMSREKCWGSVHPPTSSGVSEALSHLEEYGLENPCVLASSSFDRGLIPDDLPCYETNWVPENWAVVLPFDRTFVGTTFDFDENRFALVLHNASRGIAVVAPELR